MAIKLIVSGKVQGVSFRYYTKTKADELNLKGTVKNLNGGDVEIILEGPQNKITELINFLKQNPGSSKVSDVQTEILKTSTKFKDFQTIQ